MARFELKLPKMGESVAEATVTAWLKQVGDFIEVDDSVVEIATDKVDSDVPSEVSGTLIKILIPTNNVVKVGQTMAIIEVAGDLPIQTISTEAFIEEEDLNDVLEEVEGQLEAAVSLKQAIPILNITNNSDRFYSPLVKNIAIAEGISQSELDGISGTGMEARVTKTDILNYVAKRKQAVKPVHKNPAVSIEKKAHEVSSKEPISLALQEGDELIELSRMGKMISDHMIHSIQKAAHVTSFIEVDVTNLVLWRNKVKDAFFEREGEKLTYTPVFMMAVAAAIKNFPLVNLSFDGDKKVVIRKKINLGMAAALENGNLIVPVIHNADELNLTQMAKVVNDLGLRAKQNKLKPDEVKGGSYTVTNVGSFGSLFGTPIVNQPESAILALGAIRKMPAVLETPQGDVIAIRQKMFVSHAFDHRVINGALGGLFIKFVKDYLEAWDENAPF
jgi:2-oxoglutarate dehydrogenase E2 component (dihydrolipoamide succinyltransferase)